MHDISTYHTCKAEENENKQYQILLLWDHRGAKSRYLYLWDHHKRNRNGEYVVFDGFSFLIVDKISVTIHLHKNNSNINFFNNLKLTSRSIRIQIEFSVFLYQKGNEK